MQFIVDQINNLTRIVDNTIVSVANNTIYASKVYEILNAVSSNQNDLISPVIDGKYTITEILTSAVIPENDELTESIKKLKLTMEENADLSIFSSIVLEAQYRSESLTDALKGKKIGLNLLMTK